MLSKNKKVTEKLWQWPAMQWQKTINLLAAPTLAKNQPAHHTRWHHSGAGVALATEAFACHKHCASKQVHCSIAKPANGSTTA